MSVDVIDDHGAQDESDAHELLRLLMDEVVPAFYERDDEGLPRAWIARIRASLKSNAPRFCASRMLHDYLTRMYANGSR